MGEKGNERKVESMKEKGRKGEATDESVREREQKEAVRMGKKRSSERKKEMININPKS